MIRSVRRNGRVTSEYVASGEVAVLEARFFALQRIRSEVERQHWAAVEGALTAQAARVEQVVSEALIHSGYHRPPGRRAWRKRRGPYNMSKSREQRPPIVPSRPSDAVPVEDRADDLAAVMGRAQKGDRKAAKELARTLDADPDMMKSLLASPVGDLAAETESALAGTIAGENLLAGELLKRRLRAQADELAGPGALPLEKLLARHVESIARKAGWVSEHFATGGRISCLDTSSRSFTLPGPGEYRSDPTEGITRVDDLPKPNVSIRSRDYRRRPCPRCGRSSYRDGRGRRTLHNRGDPLTGRPRDLVVLSSRHSCTRCRRSFNADMTDLADPGSHSTRRVLDTAVRLVVEDGLPYRAAGWALWRDHRVFVPFAMIQNWVEAGGKKAARQSWTAHLDWALSDFSGFIAADELDDGPSCVLSVVDNRSFKRLAYHVRNQAPTARDVEVFFRRFREALGARGLSVMGVTTDGSSLDPEPIAAVFGDVPD
ncbi:MAG: hypothetical protein JOZ53_01165 [Planctomycetaceae bacterium]|nr:hypothetical protein [Planctomycetaceae bacterium]